ncbi:MAG: hypothetical protein VXZ39_04215, partial [Planctomycetota bacterium]|nr:hypothetical protein [Planctomycetota bacterium]
LDPSAPVSVMRDPGIAFPTSARRLFSVTSELVLGRTLLLRGPGAVRVLEGGLGPFDRPLGCSGSPPLRGSELVNGDAFLASP